MILEDDMINLNDRSKIKTFVKVAAGVIMKRGVKGELEILLIRRSPTDHFPLMEEIPRGKCDKGPDEKIIQCLKREVKEETGLDIVPLKLIDKFSYLADKGTRLSTQYNFLCKIKDPTQKIKLSNEHDDYKWITTNGQVELSVMPEIKKTISKVFNLDSQIVDYSLGDDFKEDVIEEYLRLI